MAATKVIGIYINALRIDASISEKHAYESEASQFPVESGGSIVDHIRPMPIEVSIEGVVSNTPIGEVAGERSIERVEVNNPDGTTTDVTPTPVEQALTTLTGIYTRRGVVEITTTLATYKNMAMISLDIPRDAAGGGDNALKFTAGFRQIQIVTTDRVKVRTATPGSGKRRSKGAQPAPEKLDNSSRPGVRKIESQAGPLTSGHYWYDKSINGWREGYSEGTYNKGKPLAHAVGSSEWSSPADDPAALSDNLDRGPRSPTSSARDTALTDLYASPLGQLAALVGA